MVRTNYCKGQSAKRLTRRLKPNSICIVNADGGWGQTEVWQTAGMRAVVQRVSRAQVTVDRKVVGKIEAGLLVLLGVSTTDTETDADYLADKIAGLRIFADQDGKMNRSVAEAGGAVLVVSQFTLYGDVRRGKRPSFDAAARPEQARKLYEYFVERIRAAGLRCETGQFQEMMQVELVNDGPVTILLDSGNAL
jgi:D-aminoacyl-tRNA deacylase